MHDFDVTLKCILIRPGSALLQVLTGSSIVRWLNVELPKVNNLRVDLLGELRDGELIHFEFQTRNEISFPMRMAEYAFAIARKYGRFPRQIALYVGRKPLRMKNSVSSPGLTFHFHLVDIRDLSGEALLASGNLSDNITAILTRLGDKPDIAAQIVRRIAEGPITERAEALAQLFILAGLRGLTSEVKREAEKMPIIVDVMKNEVFGPIIRKGLAEGRALGLREGREEGRVEGQMEILLGMIEKRFGSVPPRIRKRLAALKPNQLKAAGLRLLDARRVEDLFAR